MPFAEHFMLQGSFTVPSTFDATHPFAINVNTGFLPTKIQLRNQTQWGQTEPHPACSARLSAHLGQTRRRSFQCHPGRLTPRPLFRAKPPSAPYELASAVGLSTKAKNPVAACSCHRRASPPPHTPLRSLVA